MYGKTIATILSVLLLTCMAVTVFAAEIAGSKPNIVLVLVDDMGFSDLGCYGGEIDTPVLDELAESGLRFTRFTNSAKCTTSRYSLLSGQYHGSGYPKMKNSNGTPIEHRRWTLVLRNILVTSVELVIISRVVQNGF
jgi:arylsulfatase